MSLILSNLLNQFIQIVIYIFNSIVLASTSSSLPQNTTQLQQQVVNQNFENQNEFDEDDFEDLEFRHFGGIGECRHNLHCIGSEICVNFRGNFM